MHPKSNGSSDPARSLAELLPRLATGYGTRTRVTPSRLPNGLRILTVTTEGSPLVSLQIHVAAGSRDNPPGKSGLAHCVEHMMFRHPEIDFDLEAENLGAMANAWTMPDATVYATDCREGVLGRLLELERVRFERPALVPDDLRAELEVILEERLQSVDNSPQGRLFETLTQLGFPDHPYGIPVLGVADDIRSLSTADCQSYLEGMHCPTRMIVVVAGPLAPAMVEELVRDSLGKLPPSPPAPRFTAAPSIPGVTDVHLELEAELSAVSLLHPLPPADRLESSRALATAELLATLLSWGDSSRLVRRLVREERVAYDVSVSVQEQDLGSELLIESRAVGRSSPLHLRDRILQEIGRLAEEPLEPDELERARVQLTIDTVRSLRTAFGRGDLIGSIALLHDDLDRGCATREGFLDVTPDEVRDLARRLARRDSTVCVTLEAKEK